MLRTILILVFFGLLSNILAQTIANQTTQDPASSVTRVALKLNFPDTIPLVVQTAVFSKDPFAIYDSLVNQNKDFITERLSKATTQENANIETLNLMTFLWNRVFEEVTGFEVLNISSRSDGGVVVSAPNMSGKFWVTTKVSFFSSYFVCWCLPIKIDKGQAYSVEMNADNTLNLKGLFNYFLEGKKENR